MYLIKHHALMDSGVEVQLHVFVTLALGAGEWPPSLPEKETLIPLDRWLHRPQSKSTHDREKKNHPALESNPNFCSSDPQNSHCTDLTILAPT
jgi:hypothetical protein